MLRPPTHLTLVPVSASRPKVGWEEDSDRQTAHLVETERGPHPREDVLDFSHPPADAFVATTVSKLFPHNSDIIRVDFGAYLQDLQDDLAAVSGREDSPKITWSAIETDLPTNIAITFVRAADLLITKFFARALPSGRGGHVDVSFAADQDAWRLMIDDGGMPIESFADQRCDSLSIVRLLVLRHAGSLKVSGATAGTRCIVMIPRSAPEGIADAEPTSILGSPKAAD
ncbi:MAG: hypothetical protein ACRBM6_34230 [Geminicoccales bacterium]